MPENQYHNSKNSIAPLSIAVALAALSHQAGVATLYKTTDDISTIGGRIANLNSWENGESHQNNNGTFSGFAAPSGYKRKYTAQAAVEWAASETLAFSATCSPSDIDDQNHDGRADINVNTWLGGVRWTPGNWYFAVTGGQYRNVISGASLGNDEEGFSPSARGYEAIGMYNFKPTLACTDTIQIYAAQNRLWEKGSRARQSYYVLGTAWLYSDWTVALEQKLDNSKNALGRDRSNNTTQLLVRFNY